MTDPRNPELEAAIADDPRDPEAYAIYADWLEGHGDIRAALIRAQIADGNAKNPSKPVRKLLAEHRPYLLGPLSRCASALTWRNGFVYAVSLGDSSGPILEHIASVLAHPSARFVVELGVSSRYLANVIAQLVAAPPASLRKLWLGHDTAEVLAIDKIALPRLRDLTLSGRFRVDAAMLAAFPLLRWLEISHAQPLPMQLPALASSELTTLALRGRFTLSTIALPNLEIARFRIEEPTREDIGVITAASWPRLRRLELDLAGAALGKRDLEPLFQRTDLAALTELAITNATFADDICRMLVAAPFVRQLTDLDVASGSLTDAGAEILADAHGNLALASLDVSGGAISDAGFEALDVLGLDQIAGDYRYDDADE